MAALEAKLNPRQFVRIHRGTIVNFVWIKEVALLTGGALSVRLKDGQETELTVTRDRAREFKERVGY
jgi:two-component system LytT family response regulator